MDNKTEYIISLKDLFSAGINKAEQAADGLDKKASSLSRTIANIGATIGIATLAKGIFDAGTNMEGLNISLKTMLGSKNEADKLVKQMVDFAATTPFSQSEVQTAGKQLLAYGIEAKNIIPTMRQLGDVAAGLNQPIGEIAYLYGTIKTQGKAMTVDIRQFANRGIPIYEELAKVTGKSGQALQKYIEDGKIGFPQIQKAFENMSGAGGKFAGLTSELAKSTGGQWSNTKDQIEQLAVTIFNELQPAINWFIKGFQTILSYGKPIIQFIKEHTTIIKALAVAVAAGAAAFYVWKAAIVAARAVAGAMFLVDMIKYIASTQGLSFATAGMTVAQNSLNAAMTANPIGLVIAAVAALAAGIYMVIQNYEKLREEYAAGIDKNLAQATKDETKAVLELADAYEKQGFKRKEAQERALEVERQQMQLEYARAKQAADLAKANLSASPGVGMGEEMLQEDYRRKLQALNIASAKRNATFDKNIFASANAAKTTIEGAKIDTGTNSTKSTAHNYITINIDKLIEKFSITTSTLGDSVGSIKEQVVKALIEAVNDSQIVAGI